jgi:hypothetical protein
VVDAQEFIELGMQGQIVTPVGALDEQRHHKNGKGRNRIPLEGGGTADQPQQCINDHNDKGGG